MNRLLCSYCGHEVPYETPGDRSSAMTKANEHAMSCASSPLVRRVRELEGALAAREALAPCVRELSLARMVNDSPCPCSICEAAPSGSMTLRAMSEVQQLVFAARQSGQAGAVHLEYANPQGMACTVVAVMTDAQWSRLLQVAGGSR